MAQSKSQKTGILLKGDEYRAAVNEAKERLKNATYSNAQNVKLLKDEIQRLKVKYLIK